MSAKPYPCERCGKRREDVRYRIPMSRGVWCVVCRPCANFIFTLFVAEPRKARPLAAVVPALSEWLERKAPSREGHTDPG